jgi:hypothetical protein
MASALGPPAVESVPQGGTDGIWLAPGASPVYSGPQTDEPVPQTRDERHTGGLRALCRPPSGGLEDERPVVPPQGGRASPPHRGRASPVGLLGWGGAAFLVPRARATLVMAAPRWEHGASFG